MCMTFAFARRTPPQHCGVRLRVQPGGSPMKLVSLMAAAALAAGANAAVAADAAGKLRDTLKQRFPDVTVDLIRPAPVPGLFEVYTPGQVVYVDSSGEYMFAGKLLSTSTKRDLSAESWNEHNRIDFAKLPLEAAIRTVRGAGTRKLAVFTDPDCPYCRNLEKELAQLDDVTIYSFLFPLESIHKGATARARRIWCAADRDATWRAWMIDAVQPPPADCALDPVQANVALGEKLRVSSTPTLFFPDGTRENGALPRAQLEKLLDARAVAGGGARNAASR